MRELERRLLERSAMHPRLLRGQPKRFGMLATGKGGKGSDREPPDS